MEWWHYLIIYVATIVISGLLGYWLGPYFTERFALKRELAAEYLRPFKDWCSRLYGELSEFRHRYSGYFQVGSDVLLIIDYRELHEELRYTPRWVGKIEKVKGARYKANGVDRNVADDLRELADLVDRFWHQLQERYGVNFETSYQPLDWLNQIIQTPEDKRRQISQEIQTHVREKLIPWISTPNDRFERVLNCLRNQIPPERFFFSA